MIYKKKNSVNIFIVSLMRDLDMLVDKVIVCSVLG